MRMLVAGEHVHLTTGRWMAAEWYRARYERMWTAT